MYRYTIAFVGDSGVGKTSLVENTLKNAITFGLSYSKKTIRYGNKSATIRVWDTSGDDRFRFTITSIIQQPNLFFIVYNTSTSRSFNNIRKWINIIDKYNPTAKKVIVANVVNINESMYDIEVCKDIYPGYEVIEYRINKDFDFLSKITPSYIPLEYYTTDETTCESCFL